MASKPINPQPLQMPNLSQLPDPMKDLMGGAGLTNPTSLMTMNQKDIDDLFAPKPIDGNFIKPSAEAAKALETAQKEADKQLKRAAKQQQQHDEMLAHQRKEEEQRIAAYRKRAEELDKAREKALKEKKKEQGGKLGAAPDGSFLADIFIKNLTSDKAWNEIASTLERNDVMEAELAKFETHLRDSKVSDDIIQEELKRARAGVTNHTKRYEKEFTKEGLELTDLAVATGKTATNLASYAALLGTSTGPGRAVSKLIKSATGRDIQTDTVNMLVDARTAIDSKYSGTLKLRRANDQYTMEKAKRAAGGELGWVDEASTAIKSMWDNDMGVYYAIEAVPDLIGSAGAGFAGKLLLKGGAKVAGRVASKELAESTVMQNFAKIASGTMTTNSKIANFALKGLSVPTLAASSYGAASTMAATATDTYDTIRHTDSEVLANHYGVENWNALVSEVGEQKAKEILATQAARDAASNIGPVALLTSMYGLEGAVGGLMTKRAAAEVVGRAAVSKTRTAANLVGATALGAGTEALEEGYTQYGSNVAMNPLTGVDPMDGVARAAASGAYVGGVLNGTIKAADMVGTYRAINSLNNISADRGFTTNADGTVTFDSNAFKSAMGEAFATVNKVHREGHGSFSDGKAATQAYYDRIFDADERYQQHATPEQKADVQKFARENYGVNTNNFTFFDDNETSSAFKSNDIERVRATGNELLLDSYRLKHGVELDQVNPENTQVAKAIARSIDHISTLDPNLNTFQREHEFQKFIENDLDKDASLDVEDRAAIAQFMGTHYGTRAARMTNEEQATYDEQVRQYQASQQENADEPVSQANAADGAGGSRQTGGQPTQEQDTEVEADEQQVPPQSDTQSPRNADTRQADNASTTTDVPTEPNQANGRPNAGTTEVQNTRDTSNPTTSQTGGGTPTPNGNTRQADQGGQSTRPTRPSPTQTPSGGRSVGATTAERSADNGSNQTLAEALENGVQLDENQRNRLAKVIKRKKIDGKENHLSPDSKSKWKMPDKADTFNKRLQSALSPRNNFESDIEGLKDASKKIRREQRASILDLALRVKNDPDFSGGKSLTSKTKYNNGSQDVNDTNVADTNADTDWDFVNLDDVSAQQAIDDTVREAQGVDFGTEAKQLTEQDDRQQEALRDRQKERAERQKQIDDERSRQEQEEQEALAKYEQEQVELVDVKRGRDELVAANNLNRPYKENDIITAREQAKADTKRELENATDNEVLTAALLDNPQNGFGKFKDPFTKGLHDLLFKDARFERVKDRDKRGDGYRYVKRPQQDMLERLYAIKERQQGRWEAIQEEMAKRGLDKNKPTSKAPDEVRIDDKLNSIEIPIFLKRKYKNDLVAGVLVKQAKQYKFIPFNGDYPIVEVGNTNTATHLRDLGFSLFNGSAKTNLGLSSNTVDEANANINRTHREFSEFLNDVLNFEPTQEYIDKADEVIEQAIDPRNERDYEAELDVILDLLNSAMGDNTDIDRLITGFAAAEFNAVFTLQDTDPELYMGQMNDTLMRYAEAFEQVNAEQTQRNAIAGYIGYTGDVDGAKDLFANSVANGDTPYTTAETFNNEAVKKTATRPKKKKLSSKQNDNQMSSDEVIEATDTIIKENNNAEPNSTTANDTSQAEADSNATSKTNPKKRTGAKTTTTKSAGEAKPKQEPVKGKRGGRSKKKTAEQAQTAEARKILGHKQADRQDPYGYKDRYNDRLSKKRQEQTADPVQESGIRPTTPDEINTAYADYANKPNINDVVTFTTKNGSSVILEHSVEKTSNKSGVTTYYFSVVGMDGYSIGDLTVYDDPKSYPKGTKYSDGTVVVKKALLDKKYQNQGIGKVLYDFAERKLNTQLMPSAKMTPQAQAMWASWKGNDWLNTYNLTANGNTISATKKAKLTSKQQEQSNVSQDNLGQSVQPTQERTQDENREYVVGNTNTTNDGQGEVSRQSEQQDVAQQEASAEKIELGVVATNPPLSIVSSVVNLNQREYPIEYRIVSADELLANISQESNVSRNRSNQVSQDQIDSIAANPIPSQLISTSTGMDGSPILANDGNILSGNGRTLAMQKMYETNQKGVEAYQDTLKKWLNIFGFTEEQYNSVDKPIFVRMLKDPLSQTEQSNFALSANTAETLGISPLETAKSDQFRLGTVKGLAYLEVQENGDINSEKNSNIFNQFINTLPIAEQANLRSADGSFNPELLTRFKNALLVRAYGSDGIIKDMLDTTDSDLLNIRNALMRSAPTVAVFKTETANRTDQALDLSADIMSAIDHIKTAKVSPDSGTLNDKVNTHFATPDIFNPAPAIVQSLARFFAKNIRNVGNISNLLNTYYATVSEVNVNQSTFIDNPTKVEQYNGALERVGASEFAVDEQSQVSGTETTQDTEQLGVARLENRVSDKRLSSAFGNLSQNDKTVLNPNNLKPAELRADLHDKLIRPTSELSAEQNTALDNLVNKIKGVKTAPTDSQAKQVASKQSVDIIDSVFNRNPDLVASAEQAFDALNLDTNLSDFVSIVLGSDFKNADVYNVLESPRKYLKQYQNATKDNSTDVLGDFNLDKVKKEFNKVSGKESGAVTLDFLLTLPKAVLNLLSTVWNAIKNNFAKVSLAVAITTGTTLTIPTEANAATPTETAVVQNIVSQNDNQGKQFIVADKQAGTLTMYTPSGQEITSTPALFGKTTGDSISTNNATPSGRYDMSFVEGKNIQGKGYGSSAQALSVNGKLQENNAGNVAIHRVLPIENRQGRLDTPTATDNRISHGCINVPVDFYDTYLDSKQDTVVYVMPETDAGKTGVFNTPNVDVAKPTTTKDGYANAKTNTVEMTADEVTKAVNDSSQKVAKATTTQVLTVANTKPTAQIALVNSVVLPKVDVAATRMAVIQGQYTPAEQKANDKFDTEPVKEKYDGVGLSDIAVAIELALAGLAGGVALTAGRRGRGRSDTDTDTQTTTEPPVDDTLDDTQEQTPNDLPNDIADIEITDPQEVELDDTMDSQYSEFVANSDIILLSDEQQQELNQALGFETVASEFGKSVAELQAFTERLLNGDEPPPNKLKSKKTATASGVKQAMKPPRTAPQIAIDRALMIRAMNNDPNIPKAWVTMASTAADILDEQLTNAHFNRVQGSEARQWKFVSTKKGNVGALAKLLNVLGGATPLLDTVARNNNIAAVGYEADSNVLSTALAGIKMRRTGAFSVLSSRYLDPLNKNIHKLAYRTKVEQATLREDLGELANARHILDEAYAYHVKDIKEQIDIAQTAVDTIRSKIASQGGATAEQANDLSILKKHLDELNTEFKLIDGTYNGKIAWDKSKVKLPGGRVKAEWEKIISDTKAKYGENYDSLVALSDDIYNALTETRKYAAAHGVYNTDQLASINDIGFKKYVPLYKKEKTADEVLSSHPDDEVQLSIVAKTLNKYSSNYRGFAVSQTRDLSRYHRQGATSPADNAYNNLEAYLLNMAGRIAEQPFREVLQQAYEGTTYTPYSASAITDPETLAELNTPEGSKFSGLIRVPVGGLQYLPNSLKERIKAPNGIEYVKPIRAKGYDKDGNVVDFDYYFTDKAVRDELYSNVDFSLEFDNLAVNAISRLTRFQSGLFTRYNPMWNVWNYVQDSSERISNILFREVRDKDGNRINRTKLAWGYVKSLTTMTANPHVLFEILQYMHDDTKLETPLQRLLHEAKRSGAISLITSLTKRNTALQDLKKSDMERIAEYAKNKFGVVIDSNAITYNGAKIVSASAELYFNAVVELPQILTALAAYEAYKNVGVNQAETANRVRDQFDPFRTQNGFIKKASVMYPFVRAAGAGGYNLLRTLTQYWGKGDRLGTVLTLAAGGAIMYGLQAMALSALGYDDDDEPYAKRLSAADLSRGIPIMGNKGDVLFFPVGFGLNALVATISANVHSMQMGQQSGTEAMMNVVGSITHNLSPVNTGSSASWAKNPTAAAILTLAPTIVQPFVEIATNTDAFTARDIYTSKTPRDERDSEQGGANVPEKYKDYAKSMYKVGLDVRPETIQHLAEKYLVGPLKAITADINDRADKTLGAESTKGEYYGTFASAVGLDLKRSHTALSDTNYSYKMLDLQSKILKSYNVPTSHASEDYAEFGINRKTEGASALTASKLRAAGASESEISFVLNAMEFSNAREGINREYNKAKVKLVRNQAEGGDISKATDAYQQVQDYSSAVYDLTKKFVSNNRDLYDEMLQQYK